MSVIDKGRKAIVSAAMSAGIDPADDADLIRRKQQLTLTAVAKWLFCPIWVAVYGIAGLWITALVPFSYMMLSAMSILLFVANKQFGPFRRRQVLLIFLLPFVMQWSLGGFVPSSAVVLWSLLAPVTCLFFGSVGEAVRWFVAYVALLAVSVVVDPLFARIAPPVPDGMVQWFFVLNIACVSSLTFVAILTYDINIKRQGSELVRLHAALQNEVSHALLVQQVLVPNELPRIDNFAIEAVYRPAQVVGGDFFQVIPNPDGSILAVIGDVSGKGIPAAMVVALVVGTLRAAKQFVTSPCELLAILNEQLAGRLQSGFATCLVARISASGELAIANAGHLHPYLNGKELVLETELPLGVSDSSSCREVRRQLKPGDRLTFISDGVLEARSESGELFGFDRMEEISGGSAQDIVDAARGFGQEDDITVMTVCFDPGL